MKKAAKIEKVKKKFKKTQSTPAKERLKKGLVKIDERVLYKRNYE